MRRFWKVSAGALTGALLAPIMAVSSPGIAHADASTPTGYVPGVSTLMPLLTTPTGQTYLNPDGSRTLVTYNAPVRFQNADGSWATFDLTATRQADGTLTASAVPDGVRLDSTTAAATLTTSDGPIIVSHVGAVGAVATTHDRIASWSGVFGDDRTLTEAFQTNGAEESVVLPSVSDPSSYVDQFTLPSGVTVQSASDGVRFVDSAGKIVGGFGGGYATDANNHEGHVSVTLSSQIGSTATVSVSVDPNWLASAAAPVTIDPTLFSQDTNQFDTYLNSDNCGANYYYQSELRVGSDGAGPNACAFAGIGANNVSRAARIFLHFGDVDSIAVPGTVVTNSLLSMDQFYAIDAVNKKGYEIWDTATAPSTATNWGNQPTGVDLASAQLWSANGWIFPNITTAAARWVQSPADNTGLMIQAQGEYVDNFSLKKFYSVNAGVLNGPNLVITYTPPPTAKSQVSYVVIPHPDDEFEGWSLVQNSPANFPIFILMTHGENSSFCNLQQTGGLAYGIDEPGEIPPVPTPAGPGLTCELARLNSHHLALNNQAAFDTNLSAMTLTNPSASTGASLGTCVPRSTAFQVWQGGLSNAELVFDVGDGNGNKDCVTWAIQSARQWKANIPGAAGLPDYAVIGAGYYSTDSTNCKYYIHTNHAAIYSALTTVDQGAMHQWTASCGTSAAGGLGPRTGTITDSIWNDNMLVGPAAGGFNTAIGNLQQQYGWELPGNLDNGSETGVDPDILNGPAGGGAKVLFQKTQTFYTFK